MTKVTPTTEDRVERINEILDEMVRHIEEKEDLARDVADVLRLFFPGEGHRLFTSPDWRHSPPWSPRSSDGWWRKRNSSPGSGRC